MAVWKILGISMEKKELIRKEAIKNRKELSLQKRLLYSDAISDKLFLTDQWKKSDCILCYADFNNEVATDKIILQSILSGKKVFLPKVHGTEMDFYRIYSIEELERGYFGIREPVDLESEQFIFTKDEKVLMVVPGAAFDKKCNRIGYGKGFYDKYLDKYPVKDTIGIAFSCQIYDEIPYNENDKKVTRVICERFEI